MNKLATLLAAAVAAGTLGLAAPASASTHHAERRAPISIANSSCRHEQVNAEHTGDGSMARVEWVLSENGCLWYTRLRVHCAIPSRGIDAGWHNSGWIESFYNNGSRLWSAVTCPNNTFIIKAYLQWHHHVSTHIYSEILVNG